MQETVALSSTEAINSSPHRKKTANMFAYLNDIMLRHGV